MTSTTAASAGSGSSAPSGGSAPPEKASENRLVRRSGAAFVVYCMTAAIAACSQLVIARIVGAQEFGIYAYVLSWTLVFGYISTLGFDVALLRFVPAYQARQQWSLAKGVIEYAERGGLIVGTAICMIGLGVIALISHRLEPGVGETFVFGLIMVPILALLWIRCSTLRTFGGVVIAVAPDRMAREGLLLVFLAVGTFLLGWRFNAMFLTGAAVVAAVIGLIIASFGKRHLKPDYLDKFPAAVEPKVWHAAALPLLIAGSTETFLNRMGVIVLGSFGDTKAAGIYSLAFSISFLVIMPRTAVNTLLAPKISELYVRNEHTALQDIITRATAWSFAISAVFAVGIGVMAEPLLRLFGPDFEQGATALRLLTIGQLFVAGAGSQLLIMSMTGNERSAAIYLLVSALASAVLSTLLAWLYAIEGAALGTMLTLFGWNVAMAYFIWKKLDLKPALIDLVSRQRNSSSEQATKPG